jgi:uncharacterized protein (TIGR02217 family)
MAHYDDIILPDDIAYGSMTGPSTSTQQVFTNSGYRKVNSRWSQKLRKFQIGYGIKTPLDAYRILELFESVDGPTNTFLAKDWSDWNTSAGYMGQGDPPLTAFDAPLVNTVTGLSEGDGSTKTFQMYKRYTKGAVSHLRKIQKPKSGTVLVGLNGVVQTLTTHYSINHSTGIVTFVTAPQGGSPSNLPTWGGEFYVPVHFVSDDFLTSLETFNGNSVPDVELMEARL